LKGKIISYNQSNLRDKTVKTKEHQGSNYHVLFSNK